MRPICSSPLVSCLKHPRLPGTYPLIYQVHSQPVSIIFIVDFFMRNINDFFGFEFGMVVNGSRSNFEYDLICSNTCETL